VLALLGIKVNELARCPEHHQSIDSRLHDSIEVIEESRRIYFRGFSSARRCKRRIYTLCQRVRC